MDLEIVDPGRTGDDWQVWIAGYEQGACIGCGATEREAVLDAYRNTLEIQHDLFPKLFEPLGEKE